MPRLHRLTAREINTRGPGFHADGGNLYLAVSGRNARSWVFRWARDGKQHDFGLGSAEAGRTVPVRQRAATLREALHLGVTPFDLKRQEEAAKAAGRTFEEVAQQVIESLSHSFRNEKHRAQWTSTLQTHAAKLYPMAVASIETKDILAVLQPIWLTIPETASRVRGRVEKVLDAARAQDLRTGDNPARWRGHLQNLLPRRTKQSRGHHAALPYADVPAFMRDLRERSAMAALALEFTILTAARTGETIGARWSEIDRAAKVWTVPATRMKAQKDHRVPLTDRALAILDQAEAAATGTRGAGNAYVFTSSGPAGDPLSSAAMTMLLRRMERADITVHGFRSAFRDWAGNETAFQREVAEAALAHIVGDKAEQAYRRGDALEKRRALMAAWESFCEDRPVNVVQLPRAS